MFHLFHTWKYLQVSKGLLKRGVISKKYCTVCKKSRIEKSYGWTDSLPIITKEDMDKHNDIEYFRRNIAKALKI